MLRNTIPVRCSIPFGVISYIYYKAVTISSTAMPSNTHRIIISVDLSLRMRSPIGVSLMRAHFGWQISGGCQSAPRRLDTTDALALIIECTRLHFARTQQPITNRRRVQYETKKNTFKIFIIEFFSICVCVCLLCILFIIVCMLYIYILYVYIKS